MKTRALLKDTFREIKKSFGRFFSIFAIVGIGVAFFAGVKDSVPVMKNTADTYYDDYNFMDVKVMTTLGLTKQDIKAIQNLDGIEGVYGSHSMDALSTRNNHQRVFKLMSYPMDRSQTNPNYINQLRVVKGRLPKKADECVIEYTNIKGADSHIGEKITFTSGNDEKLSDALKHTTYTIVGEVTTPYYLSYEKGSSAIGSGKIDNYAILPDVNFKSEYFSEAYVTIQHAKASNSYSDHYFDIVEPRADTIKSLIKQRSAQRFDDVRNKAQQKIDDGRTAYAKNKKKFDTSIADAKTKIASSEQDIQDGEREVRQKKAETERLMKEKQAQLAQSQKDLDAADVQLREGEKQYEASKSEYEAKKPELTQQLSSLNKQQEDAQTNLDMVQQQLANPSLDEATKAALQKQKASLEEGLKKIQAGILQIQTQMQEAETQLTQAKRELDTNRQKLETGKTQLAEGQTQLNQGKAEAQNQISAAQAKLDQGKKELLDAKTKLQKEEKDGRNKLLKAKEKLDRAQEDLKALKAPTTYVLDRHSHYSYMDYGSAADRMGAIAKVFPLFFFLVAALVCLTTMTRMVDEQRQEIGTLKALGYAKGMIAMKFVVYAAVASIVGGIVGAIIGMIIFPTVIFNAWGIMYTLPPVKLNANFPLAIMAISLASIITIAAALAACYKELIETPALLMRPKAPKNGKKILLERIPWIWKRFNFIHKVTARNIFRYKKRFFMTVIGISGCSALLVAGFGIQDSIGEIATKQYGEIFRFDVTMTYKSEDTLSKKEAVLKKLQDDSRIQSATEMAVYHGFYADAGEDKGVDIYVPENVKTLPEYISLHERKSGKALHLNDQGAIITEKLAKDKGLHVGDHFAVDNGDGTKKKIRIAGITENYVGHILYMTPDYYKSIYHKTPQNTGIFAIMKNHSTKVEDALGSAFMKDHAIESVSFYSSIASSFQDTISSLSFIVVVLIISAGLLAFVVLYNLTNVNISERLREIATIKVLGFYDNEVSAYVYRENIFLALIGALAGLLLGIGLHALIMSIAELDTVMFGRNIEKISFVYAVVITMLFAIIVNLVMYRKLKNIPMVESLKSVE